MKKLIIAILLTIPGHARAQTLTNAQARNIVNTQDLLSIPRLAQAVADAAKSMKAVGFVDLDGKISTGMNN